MNNRVFAFGALTVWLVIALTFVVAALSFRTAADTKCGAERWDVKTLSDAGLKLKAPITASVEDLRAMKVPGKIGLHTPRFPVETQMYTVAANLNEYKLEADKDFHVVISGVSGATMIAEFPDPTCVASNKYRATIRKVRQQFVAAYGMPVATNFTVAKGQPIVKLTGVLFFDVLHGQQGVAPNGVELHPILVLDK